MLTSFGCLPFDYSYHFLIAEHLNLPIRHISQLDSSYGQKITEGHQIEDLAMRSWQLYGPRFRDQPSRVVSQVAVNNASPKVVNQQRVRIRQHAAAKIAGALIHVCLLKLSLNDIPSVIALDQIGCHFENGIYVPGCMRLEDEEACHQHPLRWHLMDEMHIEPITLNFDTEDAI